MTKFTPLEYLMIDIANQFGLDKKDWADRLLWTNWNMDNLEALSADADEPLLYVKAVHALRQVQSGHKTGHIMSLDATSSNIQLLSIMSGDIEAAKLCNVVSTGHREDPRVHLIQAMNQELDAMNQLSISDAADVKKALMTVFFNSAEEPKKIFGEGTDRYNAFYTCLDKLYKGPLQAMAAINDSWNPNTLSHDLMTPNGHHVKMKSMVKESKRIKVKELNEISFTYETYINAPSKRGTPLVANLTHIVDGYIVQEMHTRCHTAGIPLVTIHDCFGSSPVFMNDIRKMYVDIMAEIADRNLLQDFLRQITGNKALQIIPSHNLAPLIRDSEYMLS